MFSEVEKMPQPPRTCRKNLFSPHKPLRDAARVLYLRGDNPDPAATVQIYNKGLIELYKKVQTKKNLQQSLKERKEIQVKKKTTPGKTTERSPDHKCCIMGSRIVGSSGL